MLRPALMACLPWFGVLLALMALLRLLVRFCRPPVSWQRLTTLHSNQTGGVQSLSFVATLPVFVMVIMLIVQVSQVMIANLVVQYAAYAAARSAMVWTPARVPPWEYANQIGDHWNMPVERYDYLPSYVYGYPVYRIQPDVYPSAGGDRFAKLVRVHRAAALACMPIAPSRNPGGDAAVTPLIDSTTRAYQSVSPASMSNLRVPPRIANKLSYSLSNTTIEMRRTAPNDYWIWWWPSWDWEWGPTWRDQLTVTVTHQYALLPGPGRLLARSVARSGQDSVSGRIGRRGDFYTIPITATATLPCEGDQPSWPYTFQQSEVAD